MWTYCREYEQKLKKISYKLVELQKWNDTSIIEEKLHDKTNQVKLLVDKVRCMEEESNKIGRN